MTLEPELFEVPLEEEPAAGAVRVAAVAFPVPLHKAYDYLVPEGMDPKPGCRVRASFGPRRLVGVVTRIFEGVPERKLKKLDAVLDSRPALPEELIETAQWLSRRYGAPLGECLRAALPAFIKSLDESAPLPPASPPRPEPAFTLTPSQREALERLSAKRGGGVLLYGVPASGKTEVYLRLISQVARAGGQALFLLPEISLTKPFYEEFKAALGVPVALWHSQLTPMQRRKTWLALRRGDVKVVVGARSAAMLPFADLRLIVLDEEHDESFKEEGRSPLYHARDVALKRGQAHGALVVLGSATPSLESWQAVKRGELELLAMPDRVSKLARPGVLTVPLPFGRCLSEELVFAVRERLKRGEQSILLVNRRGFSTLFMCGKCGWVMRCEDCGVAMIQHELGDGASHLRCHHCERTSPVPAGCPQGHGPLRILGAGTQKVVAELKKFVPEARVLRMDSDTVLAEKKADRRAYDLFKAGEADVLVGTKLIAKSFHFPDVTLVGVVDADTMLHMPEFRSSERTMQLLAQVAGRSGRAEKPGEVLLQTLQPDHIAIASAGQGDYAAFAEKELASRRELGYPPFTTLIRLIWADPVEEKCADRAQTDCSALRDELAALGHEVVGPAPAVLPRAYGKFRWHALVKVAEGGLEAIVGRLRSLKDVKVNVDPYDLF